ncbi:FecR family protein [Lunatimonas salinarum]|uniref:FecR family protein n=1 Tax=Lunatimonas salinarum TaxID=1774590 RepID=UPI001ADFE572|nr:FecR family protein [Lunatimonas salinarum]
MIKKLLNKLHQGRLSRKESKELAKWLKSPASDSFFNEKYDQLIEEMGADDGETLSADEQAKLKRSVVQRIRTLNAEDSHRREVARRFRWGIAASLTLLIGFGWYYKELNQPQLGVVEQIAVVEWIEKENPAGKKTLIHLPDGSKVYLNSESKLSYRKDFGDLREVKLSGEAFFEVEKDSLHPFTVQAENLTTHVIGTSFNVRAYPEEQVSSVVLTSGVVETSVPGLSKSETLRPGEGLSVSKATPLNFRKFTADVEAVQYWREGILHFEGVSFSELVRILERWYGVEIEVKGNMPQGRGFNGTFKQQETLVNVLEAMQFARPFHYQTYDKKVSVQF